MRKGMDFEDSDLHQRRGCAELDKVERDQENHSSRDAGFGIPIAPTPNGRLLEPEHAEPDTADDQDQSPIVDPRLLVGRRRFGKADQDEGDRATGMLTQKIAATSTR